MRGIYLAVVLGLCGCGGSEPTEHKRTGESGGGGPPTPAAVADRLPPFASLREPIVRTPAGFERARRMGAWQHASEPLEVRLPAAADGPVRLRSGDLTIEVRAAYEPRANVLASGALVAVNAATDCDAVWTLSPLGAEELRVLRSAAAPSSMRYELRPVTGVGAIRLVDGRVQVLDPEGRPRIETGALFAIDARGVRRAITPRLSQLGESAWLDVAVDTTGLAFPVTVDPIWTSAGAAMKAKRVGHVAVLLSSGKVLLAGGADSWLYSSRLSSAELYDPGAKTFTTTGSMGVDRMFGQGIVLSGKAYVAGGNASDTAVERFDDAAGTWSPGATMLLPRSYFVLTKLPSGKAIAIGGAGGSSETSVESFDPATGTGVALTPMSAGRGSDFGGLPLMDGRIMVFGGGGVSNPGEIYDPSTNAWTALPLGPFTPSFSASRLADGRVLVSGTTATIFDPVAKTWTSVPDPNFPRRGHRSITMPNGAVLIVGGSNYGTYMSEAEVYDPTRSKWLRAGAMVGGRVDHSATLLSDGRVLVAGGLGDLDALSTAEVFAPQANGAACAADGECFSLFCADGVCCNAACSGACQTCSATPGTCSALTGSPLPGHPKCGAYAKCTAGVCDSKCTVDTDCASDSWCSAGSCVGKKAKGLACGAGGQCATGICVDSVCCDRACGGQCEACDITGKTGTCAPAFGAPHGTRTSCTGTGVGTACGIACDGVSTGGCTYPSTATPCGVAACSALEETHASYCNGAGKCGDTPKSCGVYACGPTSCKTSCATTSDCIAGYYCKASACVPVEGLGKDCGDPTACGSTLFCTDGVCCGVASCGAGSSCATAPKRGSCAKQNGIGCTAGDQCGSGLCVDGVCCESACTGQCQACDVAGKAGSCVPVKGAPHAGRTECAKDATNPCASASCDGSDSSKCAALAGAAVSCREASCSDATGTATAGAHCAGAGECPIAVVTPCNGFSCDPVTKTCRTACTKREECASGYSCLHGACVRRNGTCSADGTALVAADGTTKACAPFRCRDDQCITACTVSDDCLTGYLCDSSSGLCVPAAAPAADSGGCSSGKGAPSGGLMFAALATLAVAARARRRRSVGLVAAGLGLVIGCAADDGGSQPTAPRESPSAKATAAMDTLRGFPYLAGDLHATRLADTGGGVLVTMPLTARHPLRLADRGDADLWIEIGRSDGAGVAGEDVDGARVHSEADIDTDVVFLRAPGRVEELRILRSSAAPREARYRLRHGPGVAEVRLDRGSVEVVDARGIVRLRSLPMVAIDARGVRREVPLTMGREGGEISLVARPSTEGLAYPIVVDPAWVLTATMKVGHSAGLLELLPGGKALAAGGNVDGVLSEIYDPAADAWTTVGSMSVARFDFAATRTPAGNVVALGGVTAGGGCTSAAEMFDPTTKTWASLPSMSAPRRMLPAVAVGSGSALRVIVAGGDGCTGDDLSTAERLDPTTKTWAAAGPMASARRYHTMNVLPGNRVLVIGGEAWAGSGASVTFRSSAEVYDLATNSWSTVAAKMSLTRSKHTATTLADGRVLVAGGFLGGFLAQAEIFDPVAGTWTSAAPMKYKHAQHAAVLLASGRVLVSGGFNSFSAYTGLSEVYDPARNVWLDAGDIGASDTAHHSVRLADDRVLTVGYSAEVFSESALGAACGTAGECVSGYCTDGVCCSTGACGAGAFCNTATKKGTCAKANGAACTLGAECGSAFCTDGVCCEAACGAQCQACDVLGSVGKCVPVTGQSHGSRSPCADGSLDPCLAKTCNGVEVSTCQYPTSGVVACGSATCGAGIETHASTCSAGRCADVASSCGAFVCGTSACKTACASKSDCAAGYYCSGAACLALDGLGASCSDASSCGGGLSCVDSVCCAASSCPSGATCADPSRKGTCMKLVGTSCSLGPECASGFCADGRCCDKACDGQCEACDVPGSAGKCTPVTGSPHGARASCAADPADPCATAQCDGAEASKCAAFVKGDVSCRAATCAAGVATPAGICDGSGKCPAAKTVPCGGFICDPTTRACRVACATADDCVKGFVCQDGKCKEPTDACSADSASVVHKDGSTAPCGLYRCSAGACLTECVTSNDCLAATCDLSTKTCVKATGSDESGGGCAVGPTGAAPALPGWALLLALALHTIGRGVRRARVVKAA